MKLKEFVLPLLIRLKIAMFIMISINAKFVKLHTLWALIGSLVLKIQILTIVISNLISNVYNVLMDITKIKITMSMLFLIKMY